MLKKFKGRKSSLNRKDSVMSTLRRLITRKDSSAEDDSSRPDSASTIGDMSSRKMSGTFKAASFFRVINDRFHEILKNENRPTEDCVALFSKLKRY